MGEGSRGIFLCPQLGASETAPGSKKDHQVPGDADFLGGSFSR